MGSFFLFRDRNKNAHITYFISESVNILKQEGGFSKMRQALEDLVFLGSIEDTFTLLGKNWTIKTLTAEDQLSATSGTASYDTLARVNALRIRVLSHALKKVDGVELKDADETYEFLTKLQQPVINALFSKYERLLEKQDEALRDLDEIKN